MSNFTVTNTTQIYFGKGTEELIGRLAAQYGTTDTVMLVTYQGNPLKDIVDRLRNSIEAEGLKCVEYAEAVPNPLLDKAREGIEIARKNNAGLLIGIGGGSCIDMAKAIAAGVNCKSDLWDLYTGKAAPADVLPIGAVTTLAGTGSESSPYAVLTNTETQQKIGFGVQETRPKFAILNPEFTYGVNAYQTACGSCDMFAHILDDYLGRSTDMPLSYRICESVMRTVAEFAPIAIKDPTNYTARAQLLHAGTMAMGKLATMGLDTNLGLHTMAEDLGAVYNVTHGAALSVLIPAWMTYLKSEKQALLARFAKEVWNIEVDAGDVEKTIDLGIARTKEFFVSLGLPVTLKELGIDFEKDGRMLADRMAKKGDYGDAYISLTPEIAYSVYEMSK